MTDTAPRSSAGSRADPGASSTIAVLGAGTMGRGIAQLAAQAAYAVRVYDPDAGALARARSALDEVFAMLHAKGRLTEDPQALSRRITFHGALAELADATWVLEAAPEDLVLKQDLFRRASQACPDAYLATNTSTLSVTAIAAATARPAQVVGIHFFNPAPLMRLVEVVPGVQTRAAVTEAAVAFARSLGRSPVVARDRPGFIVNRVARPYYGEALRLAGEGVPVATIDLAMRAVGFRMGPFELLDLIGLDVNLHATESVYHAFFEEPRYRPHPLQRSLVTAGRLGRKSGNGFYSYDGAGAAPPEPIAAPVPRTTEAGTAPVMVVGDTRVARWLRQRLPTTTATQEAALLLDARIDLASKAPLPGPATCPLATLVWGHSASRAVDRYGRAIVGFSLLPPAPANGSDAAHEAPPGPVVELCCPQGANPAVLEPTRRALEANGLATLEVPDRAGGIAFRLLALLVNEAVSALAEGLATRDAIDEAMRLGVNYPEGPLAWGAALGIDEVELGLRGLQQELGAERFGPQSLLTRLAAVGATAFPAEP